MKTAPRHPSPTDPGESSSDWKTPVVPVELVLAAVEPTYIDLRSPAEFGRDHLPGAHNVPLFDDVQRALIGTLFARESPEEAFREGRRIVLDGVGGLLRAIGECAGRELDGSRAPGLVEEITARGLRGLEATIERDVRESLPKGALVIHCWRGGLRSASVALLLRRMGIDDVYLIEGGYKAYRRHVVDSIAEWSAPPSFVLRGFTGVGKTLLLRELERRLPNSTIDLEGLAGHRSSILGMVGLEPVSQRSFESGLATRLRAGFPGPVVFEGESRKVGDAIVPESVWRALKTGANIKLEASLERRVEVLLEDYLAKESNREQLAGQLPFIEQRLGPNKWKGELVARLHDGREAELVEILLEHYYDPLYGHSEKGREYAHTLSAEDPVRAAAELAEWLEAG